MGWAETIIKHLIGTFYANLESEKMKEDKRLESNYSRYNNQEPHEIPLIEKLLETPITDHRKLCLQHILIPYLVNIKGIPKSEISLILEKWIKEYDKKQRMDFDYKHTIKSDLRTVKDHKPISIENLKKIS